MNKITLSEPLLINGQKVTELTYNTNEITAGQFCEAEALRWQAAGNKAVFNVCEFDHGFHMYLGMMAVIAVMPHVDIMDLERLKGRDMVQLMKIGQNFILAGAGTSSEVNSSGATSETMPELTTATPANS